jgi:site-specific recombinase XerC
MEQNEVTGFQKTSQDITASNSLFSELVPAYLEYVRVEQGRPPVTIERYRARLQRFIDELGNCPVGEITPAKLSLYKRHLMDSGLGPVTIGGFLSCLRGFLRYLRDVQGPSVRGCGLICGLKLAKVDARTAP